MSNCVKVKWNHFEYATHILLVLLFPFFGSAKTWDSEELLPFTVEIPFVTAPGQAPWDSWLKGPFLFLLRPLYLSAKKDNLLYILFQRPSQI